MSAAVVTEHPFWGVAARLVERMPSDVGREAYVECCGTLRVLFSYVGGCGDTRIGSLLDKCGEQCGSLQWSVAENAGGGSGEACDSVGVADRSEGCGSKDVPGFGSGTFADSEPVRVRGKHWWKNQKRAKKRAMRCNWRETGPREVVSDSAYGSGASVRTVGVRTGADVEASQSLVARRVAENKRAEVEAKVAAALAEHKLRALGDKGRTAVVERLAAARYEQRINEARLRAQKSFSASEDSLKSLGSMGSAGELYAKQAIKKSRDDAKTLKYVQDQAALLLEHVSPEVRQMVAEMPAPVYDDEFEVFGDCPSDFDDEQREAYYADLNRANFELGQVRVESEGHREATPEELLRIKEELAALSVY